MIRSHESPLALRAGIFSILVHLALLGLLLVSVNWKSVPPMRVAEVQLWDSLPAPQAVPEPLPPQPTPQPLPEIKPKAEPEPEPLPEPKAEIQVENKKPVEQKPKPEEKKPVEKPKPDPELKAREEARKKLEQQKLLELQKMIAAESSATPREAEGQQDAAPSAADISAMDEAMAKIASKIKGYVNPQLCGSGKPELKFQIALLPTGEVVGSPKLLKSSGIAACDSAVERAILQAQPLPLPSKPELMARFRDLILPFYPNGR